MSETLGLGPIIAAGVKILPLFIVPIILKKSLDGIGNIGATINSLGGKLGGVASGKASKAYESSALGQYKKYSENEANKRRALIQSGEYKGRGGRLNPRNWGSSANRFINARTGEFGNRRTATGIELADQMEDAELKTASVQLNNANLSKEDLRVIASGGKVGNIDASKNKTMRAAAIQKVVSSNDIKGINDMWDQSLSWGDEDADLRKTLASSLQSSSSRPAYIGEGAIENLRQKTHKSINETIDDSIESNTYSAERIATTSKDELSVIANAAFDRGFGTSGSKKISKTAHQNLINNAHRALTDPILSNKMGKNLDHATNIMKAEDAKDKLK